MKSLNLDNSSYLNHKVISEIFMALIGMSPKHADSCPVAFLIISSESDAVFPLAAVLPVLRG